MIQFLLDLWETSVYVCAVVAASLMVGCRLPKKENYWLKAVLLTLFISLASYGFDRLIALTGAVGPFRLFLRTSNCLLVFLLTVLMIRIINVASLWQALFCVTAGYCMEHMSHRLYTILSVFHPIPAPMNTAVVILIKTVIYIFIFYIAIRKIDVNTTVQNNRIQILIAFLVICAAIYINSFALREVGHENGNALRIYISIFSILTSVMGLFIEFYQVGYLKMKSERDILKQLLYQEAAQYQREKDTIDAINVKYHDLKHQLHLLEKQYGKDSMKQMRQAIDGYDTYFHTGNVALDTVLTMKSYTCNTKGIQFTCMADGEKLNQIAEEDIYSLFGNLLDNAIEATEGLPQEKRVISLNVMGRNSLVFIHSENYFQTEPQFVDGLPQTTKEDKTYHGFGSHSIHLLAAKYNGNCTFRTEAGIFYTDIVLSINPPA